MGAEEDYWRDHVSQAADECGLQLTEKQLECIAEFVQSGHEHYHMAFYSPPASDRISEIEREHRLKLGELQDQLKRYQRDADYAVKMALGVDQDSSVSIGSYGEVFINNGTPRRVQ